MRHNGMKHILNLCSTLHQLNSFVKSQPIHKFIGSDTADSQSRTRPSHNIQHQKLRQPLDFNLLGELFLIMFALLTRCVDLFRLEIFIKEVGEVDEVSGFVVTWHNCGMEHQAREVDFIVRSVMALWTREDGGERTAEGFINRIISEGIACEAFVELVLGGVKDRMKVLCSIFLLGGLEIIRQNYSKSQSCIYKVPRNEWSYLSPSGLFVEPRYWLSGVWTFFQGHDDFQTTPSKYNKRILRVCNFRDHVVLSHA